MCVIPPNMDTIIQEGWPKTIWLSFTPGGRFYGVHLNYPDDLDGFHVFAATPVPDKQININEPQIL